MDQLHQLELGLRLGVIPGMLAVLHSLCSEVKQRLPLLRELPRTVLDPDYFIDKPLVCELS